MTLIRKTFYPIHNLFSYTIRGALFGATIFGSQELGIWKDGETSREVAKIIIAILTPIAKKAESEMPAQVSYHYQYHNFKKKLTYMYDLFFQGKIIAICRKFKIHIYGVLE